MSSQQGKLQRWLFVVMTAMGLCIGGYIVGPPLYWHLMELITTFGRSSSCPPCACDCSSRPLLSTGEGLGNNTLADCLNLKHESGVTEEMERKSTDALSEKLRLKEAEALESQRHSDMALLEAKKAISQYQKEADKCNSGMETCEEAREKTEAALEAQRTITAMWELRALKQGWKEDPVKTQAALQDS